MKKTRQYDTKVKVSPQNSEDSVVQYKPSYHRLIVTAKNSEQAKEAAELFIKEAYEKTDEDHPPITVKATKCNSIKLLGWVDADKILNDLKSK